MKFSTLTLVLAGVPWALSANTPTINISIDIEDDLKSTDGLTVSCIQSGIPRLQAPVDLPAAIKALWLDGFKTPNWVASEPCATGKGLSECTIVGQWKEYYETSEDMRSMLRDEAQLFAAKGWSGGYCSVTVSRYTLVSFTYTCSGSLIKSIGSAEEEHEVVLIEGKGGNAEAAIINAHCDSLGTAQSDPEVDVASAVADIFDKYIQPAPWTGTASCSSTSDPNLCAVLGKYSEPGACNAICKAKIRIEARRVAKERNSKVQCYFGVDRASATATFDWVLSGSLVKSVVAVANKVENQKIENAELK